MVEAIVIGLDEAISNILDHLGKNGHMLNVKFRIKSEIQVLTLVRIDLLKRKLLLGI